MMTIHVVDDDCYTFQRISKCLLVMQMLHVRVHKWF